MTKLAPFKTLYPGYYQTAYATNDFDRAVKQVGEAYRIKEWFTMPDLSFHTSGGKSVTIKVALANVGDSQIEIIEPVEGDGAIYSDALTGDGFQVVFHHVCQAFDTKDQYMAHLEALKRQDVRIPILVSNDMAFACYADFRQQVGHYIEYVWFTDGGRAWMDTIPRN